MAKSTKKIITFFSTIPLEFGGGAEILTMQTAQRLEMKKEYSCRIITSLSPDLTTKNIFKKFIYRFQYDRAVLFSTPHYSKDAIKLLLGKTEYHQVQFWKLFSYLSSSDTIIAKSDLPSLIPVALAVMHHPHLRKHILIQFHTPLQYRQNPTPIGKVHNFIYTSIFYKWFVHMIAAKYHVLNSSDKKIIKGATLIKSPCDDIFFNAPKANITVPKRKTIIIAGRFAYQKGFDMLPTLLQYLKRIKALDMFRFLIIGNGEMEEEALTLARKYKNVKVKINIPHDKMPVLLAKGNIFLMLSRYEGSPLLLGEALAKGLLIIAFSIPGIYTKKTQSLLSFAQPFEIKDIAKALVNISKLSRKEFMNKSEQNIEFAKKEYRMDSYIKKIESLLS